MNSLCTPSRFDVSLSFRKLRGRHCPHSPLHSPLQEKILHLTQKKHPHPIDCSLVLSLELFMEDDPSLNVDEPPDIHECSTSVKVDASLLRFIDGKGGRTKKQIENDTATHLKIPSVREAKHGKCLVVKGKSQAKVDDAVSQIHRVLEDAAESPSLDYSHFISLPLALHSDLVVQVTRFHDSVMALLPAKDKLAESAAGHGIEESIFIKPATLHITVLMLKLWNKERVAAALDVLEGLKSKLLEALESRPVSVRLKGLECMKGSPAKAHVLYARVEDADQENRLISACKVIKDAFIEAGLVSEKDKKQQFKLHATLMNTSYRKRRRGQRFGRRMPFDARSILSMHGSEEWGEYTVTEAHLSERFVYDEDGYYHCCGSVKFPLSSALST